MSKTNPLINQPRSVRFTPWMVAAMRRVADSQGMSMSAWLRKIISAEIARREGVCPTCGQATADSAAVTAARRSELAAAVYTTTKGRT